LTSEDVGPIKGTGDIDRIKAKGLILAGLTDTYFG